MAGYITFLVIGLGLIPFAFWIDNVNKNSTLGKEHPEKLKKPLHKRWWIYLIALILVVGSIGNLADPSTYKSTANKSHRLAVIKKCKGNITKLQKLERKVKKRKSKKRKQRQIQLKIAN